MGQLAIEEKDYDSGKAYLQKVMEVDPKNKWAKSLLATIPANGDSTVSEVKPKAKAPKAKTAKKKIAKK